jgi:endoglucanase
MAAVPRQVRAGRVEAFLFQENAQATARSITVDIASQNTAETLIAGVYTDRRGRPGRLSVSGETALPTGDGWATVPVNPTGLAAGRAYWLAVLGKGGTLATIGASDVSCISESTSAESFPSVWQGGNRGNDCVSAGVGTEPLGPSTSPPGAPSNLRTSNITDTSVTLSWTAGLGATSYDAQRNGGNTASASGTSFDFTGLSCGTTYTLGVQSVNSYGTSSYVTTTAMTSSCGGAGGTLSGISVSGNHLVDGSGKTVVLHGVDRDSPEYQCANGFGIFDGSTGTNDDGQPPLIASWGANSEFIGLNEDCWLGINGIDSASAGTNYESVIEHYVKTMEATGLYPVIGLFSEAPGTTKATTNQDPMPDDDHAPLFWEEVADAFKNDPNVIFRLKEEPYPNNASSSLATWQCWSQGDVSYSTTSDNPPPTPPTATGTPGKCAGMVQDPSAGAYQAVGMQSLINIIRGTGARNVIQVPGVAYANMLACSTASSPASCGFLDSVDGVQVSDPLRSPQLMADVDVYPDMNECGQQGDTSCYDATYGPVVQVMPMDVGETGTLNEYPTRLTDTLLNWMDSQHQSYYAWAWDTYSDLISDWNGTPKSPFGTDYKSRLETNPG